MTTYFIDLDFHYIFMVQAHKKKEKKGCRAASATYSKATQEMIYVLELVPKIGTRRK